MTMIVRIEDVRAAAQCVSGARRWFQQEGLDFRSFLIEGLDAEILRATGDPLALRAIAEAEKRLKDNNHG